MINKRLMVSYSTKHRQMTHLPNTLMRNRDPEFSELFSLKHIRMLFCHMYIAPFAHERIKHMGIYFPRHFITTAEHVVQVKQIKYLGK